MTRCAWLSAVVAGCMAAGTDVHKGDSVLRKWAVVETDSQLYYNDNNRSLAHRWGRGGRGPGSCTGT